MPADLGSLLPPGKRLIVQSAQGPIYRGVLRKTMRGWLLLETDSGRTLLNLDHVTAVIVDGPADGPGEESDDGLMRPQPLERPRVLTRRAPARPWVDEDLRKLATGFLDGEDDAALATAHHRARTQVRELRQGFECARGNLVEDQISPVAQTWVARWRRVLTPT
jgi:hypothetical protein